MNWTFEGSNDASNYDLIDTVTNIDVYSPLQILTRKVSVNKAYSTFKMTLNGLSSGNTRELRVYKLDFFGDICFFGRELPSKNESANM